MNLNDPKTLLVSSPYVVEESPPRWNFTDCGAAAGVLSCFQPARHEIP